PFRKPGGGGREQWLEGTGTVGVARRPALAPVGALSAPRGPAGRPPGVEAVLDREVDRTSLDATKWVRETGGGGWGNAELEFYTDRPENAHIDAGYLVIAARRETFGNRDYTSARVKTPGFGAWQEGRLEAQLPIGRRQRLVPA